MWGAIWACLLGNLPLKSIFDANFSGVGARALKFDCSKGNQSFKAVKQPVIFAPGESWLRQSG